MPTPLPGNPRQHPGSALISAEVRSSNVIPDPFATICKQLASIRNPKPRTALADKARYERDEMAVKAIYGDFRQRCEILHDGYQPYLFNKESKGLIGIDGSFEFSNLLTNYVLLPGDPFTKKTRNTIGGWVMRDGKRVAPHAVAHYDELSHRLYLHLGNGQVCRVSTQQIEAVDNGTDGVLFRDTGQEAFNIDLQRLPSCDYGLKVTDSPLCNVLNANWLGDTADQHQLYLCRFFALLFPGMFGANFITIHTGEHKSGKTSAALKIGWLLMGEKFGVTVLNQDIKDVETTLTNAFMVVFDNTDNKNAGRIQDLIAVAATGGTIERRRLYSDNTSVSRPIVSQICFTSRAMPFDRDDVIDRCLMFSFGKFDQLGGPPAMSEKDIKRSVLSHRDALMAEVIVRCQRILRSLQAKCGVGYSSNFRMKDFSRFCLAVADDEGWRPQMERIFGSATAEQTEISIQANPLHTLLRLAVGKDPSSLLRPMPALELGRRLDQVSAIAHLPNPAKNAPAALSRLLGESETGFRNAFGMRKEYDKSDKRFVYSFHPTEETKDRCVAEWQRISQPREEAACRGRLEEVGCSQHSGQADIL